MPAKDPYGLAAAGACASSWCNAARVAAVAGDIELGSATPIDAVGEPAGAAAADGPVDVDELIPPQKGVSACSLSPPPCNRTRRG